MQVLDPAVQRYLAELTERTQLLLLADLVGVYAAGSLALDAYEPGRSDIDIAIVCAAELPLTTKQAIVAALRQESLPCPARGLELVVYRSEVAGAGTSEPGFEVELNTGPRMDFRATYAGADRPAQDGLFWYAVDRSIVAEKARVLLGPPASQVFRSVSDHDLVLLLIASLRWHLGPGVTDAPVVGATAGQAATSSAAADEAAADDYAAWTDDAVLNSCRALQRMRTGHWFSKIEAGRQLLDATGDHPPTGATAVLDPAAIRQSLAARTGSRPPSVQVARRFQREVLGRLEAIARS